MPASVATIRPDCKVRQVLLERQGPPPVIVAPTSEVVSGAQEHERAMVPEVRARVGGGENRSHQFVVSRIIAKLPQTRGQPDMCKLESWVLPERAPLGSASAGLRRVWRARPARR